MTAILIKLKWNYIRNNMQSVLFLLSFILLNVILFTSRLHAYSAFGPLVMLARANGQCLNCTCAFIIICVFRKSITKLRSIGFSEYLPLDHHVYFHKLTGWAIVFYSIFHTVAHVVNFRVLSKITTISWFDFLFSTYLGIGWIGGAACLTGWILLVILILMMIPAQPFMRRSGKFEVFYFTHLLYIPFYICLFIHAPNFWIWFIGPLVIFLVEWIIRVSKSYFGDNGLTYVEQGIILPSRVIQLIIKRPVNLEFRPGDYVYVQIPHITQYEWHPLTISSAPEQEGIVWLHIRAVGEWTNRVYNYFNMEGSVKASIDLDKSYLSETDSKRGAELTNEDEGQKKIRSSRKSIIKRMSIYKNSKVMILPVPVDCNEFGCGRQAVNAKHRKDIEMATSPISKGSFRSLTDLRSPLGKQVLLKNAIILDKPLKVRLDGPYGSPSSHIFHTQHAVLIATGIGVTPFASILQSIMLRYIEAKRSCPSCTHSWSDPIPPNVMKLRKVDFMWINRDQKSFEWFVELLSELEMQQTELEEKDRFLDIHMYITSALNKSDIKAIGLQLELDFMHEESQRGLKTRTHPGRPKWNKFFEEISRQKKGRVTVFFCGPPELGRSLHQSCNKFGFQFCKEIF